MLQRLQQLDAWERAGIYPKNRGFGRENPIEMDNLGVPHDLGNFHLTIGIQFKSDGGIGSRGGM